MISYISYTKYFHLSIQYFSALKLLHNLIMPARKKAPHKKVIAPIFSFMRKSKQERHVKDSFLNPIRAEPENWQKIFRVLKEGFFKKTIIFLLFTSPQKNYLPPIPPPLKIYLSPL